MSVKFLTGQGVDGDVGIGTNSPSAKLDVRTANGNTQSLRIGRLDAASYWDFNHAGNDLRIYNNGGTGRDILLGVNGGGTIYDNKVGIGTATPSSKLEVAGDIKAVDSSNRSITLNVGSSNQIIETTGGLNIGAGTGSVRVTQFGQNSELTVDDSAQANKIVLKSNGNSYFNGGNVGIGETSPDAPLHIKSTNYEMLKLEQNDGFGGFIRFLNTDDGVGWYTGISGTEKFVISRTADNSVPIITVEQNGNVGIGTASPDRPLSVVGGNSMVARFQSTNTTAFIQLSNTVSTADQVRIGSNGTNLVLSTNYAERMRITSVGAIKFNAYDSTNNTGTPTYLLGTDVSGNVVKVLGSNILTAPATPGTITSTIVGETIEISFNESTTSNIDYYQVWSSDDGGDFGIIAQITPTDFSSTMTVVDTTFVTGGTMSYRVYAVKSGVYSSPGTTSIVYTVGTLDVTDMTVINLNTAYYIQYEKPASRFIDHIEIYMDSQTTQGALNRSNASIIYSGQNTSFMKSVGVSNNFHQFWVEVVTT